jgi:tetratricopeptide (TPR) repeat protein
MDAFELAFSRAKCLEALGRVDEARAAYVEAMDLDERYRRTTSAFNRAVVEVAQQSGVPLVETRAACEALEPIPAYRSFYDHIHFTPEGALNVAVFVAERLREWRVFDPAPETPSELETFQQEVLAELDERVRAGEDFPEHDRWIGFNFDAGVLADPGLWKYDVGVRELAASVREDAPSPLSDVRRGKALTYLGNALAFEVGRGDEAARAYQRALELVPEWADVLRANLDALERHAR